MMGVPTRARPTPTASAAPTAQVYSSNSPHFAESNVTQGPRPPPLFSVGPPRHGRLSAPTRGHAYWNACLAASRRGEDWQATAKAPRRQAVTQKHRRLLRVCDSAGSILEPKNLRFVPWRLCALAVSSSSRIRRDNGQPRTSGARTSLQSDYDRNHHAECDGVPWPPRTSLACATMSAFLGVVPVTSTEIKNGASA